MLLKPSNGIGEDYYIFLLTISACRKKNLPALAWSAVSGGRWPVVGPPFCKLIAMVKYICDYSTLHFIYSMLPYRTLNYTTLPYCPVQYITFNYLPIPLSAILPSLFQERRLHALHLQRYRYITTGTGVNEQDYML